MIVKELKEILSQYSDFTEVLILDTHPKGRATSANSVTTNSLSEVVISNEYPANDDEDLEALIDIVKE